MAVRALLGRRPLVQAFRVQVTDWDSASRLGSVNSSSRQYVLSGKLAPSYHPSGHIATSRHYSSEAKDDLRVRYLDGEDAGELTVSFGLNAAVLISKVSR